MSVPGMVLQSLCVFSARAQKATSMGEVVPLLVHSSPSDNEHNLCHLFNPSVKFYLPHIATGNSLGVSYAKMNLVQFL